MIAAKAREEADTARATGHRGRKAQYAPRPSLMSRFLEGRLSALRGGQGRPSSLGIRQWTSLREKGQAWRVGKNAPGLETSPGGATAENSPTVLRALLGSQLRRPSRSQGHHCRPGGEEYPQLSVKNQQARAGTYRDEGTGRRRPPSLCMVVTEKTQNASSFLSLPRKSNTPDWWQEYSDILP